MTRGFTFLEHPSDIGIEAVGETLQEAFKQATVALMAIIVEVESLDEKEERYIKIQATDYEQLLVKWLNEILYLYDGENFLVKKAKFLKFSPVSLEAKVFGEKYNAQKHHMKLDVKAVTYHQLAVKSNEKKSIVRVFFDI